MKSLAYKIVYKNNTCREDVLNDLERSDLDAASIKYQIAKENGLSFENFKIYAVDPQDSTKVPVLLSRFPSQTVKLSRKVTKSWSFTSKNYYRAIKKNHQSKGREATTV